MHYAIPLMTSRPKSTPSLQSLLDTYHYLVRGFKRDSATPTPRHATDTARQMVVPAALRREMAATVRTIPQSLGVAGLSSATVRINGTLFLQAGAEGTFLHIEESALTPFPIASAGNEASEYTIEWHRCFYTHPAIGAVLMVHPAAAVACAVQGIAPDAALFPAAFAKVGEVRLVSPDSTTWQSAIAAGAALLVSDGTLITHDRTLAGAIAKAEIVARWCEVMYVGQTGSPP